MTIKIHLHRAALDMPRHGISAGSELGHLYSDDDNPEQLRHAAEQLGLWRGWLQRAATGIPHFDLWGTPLVRAKRMYQAVDDPEFWEDIANKVARTKHHKEETK